MSFNIENYFSNQTDGEIILFYKGNVDSDVINHVLDTVEGKMVEVNEQSKLRKKVYNVLVESLQNLYHHVDRVPEDFYDQTSERFGLLVVKKVERGYKIITGNFVHADNIEKLEEKLKRISRSSHEEIKELYKFILNHQRISAKGGGGLGLVDIARKTGNNMKFKFEEYNSQYSFFYLDILVNEDEYENNF
ncbi:MAG TPA: SiaB family protein kinase [Bacteroidales bacterium]|nr:SiaB family protein kinase [Bacteroidales bacterium]HPT21973.1 SiaB family protein kinase [Bacteroidales bacterium]